MCPHTYRESVHLTPAQDLAGLMRRPQASSDTTEEYKPSRWPCHSQPLSDGSYKETPPAGYPVPALSKGRDFQARDKSCT